MSLNQDRPASGTGEEEDDDIALMRRTKAGDLAAFEQLVVRHQHSVVGTAAKMLRSARRGRGYRAASLHSRMEVSRSL